MLDIPELSAAIAISESTSIFDNIYIWLSIKVLYRKVQSWIFSTCVIRTAVTPDSSATPLLTSNQHITSRHHSILPPTPKALSFSTVWLPSKLVPYQTSQPPFNQDTHAPRNITSSKFLIPTITSPWSTDPANGSLDTKYPLLSRGLLSASYYSPTGFIFPAVPAITSHPRLSTNTTTPHNHCAPTVTNNYLPRPPTHTPSPTPTSTSLFHFL